MTLGVAGRQGDLFDDLTRFCSETLAVSSVYAVLARERDRLFPDVMFADLFASTGRRSVPPSVVATVMVLQRLEGLSDREAVERFAFDARWRYAAGVGGYDGDGWDGFVHTVLVDMRARLAGSDDPRRIFAVTVDAASAAGLVGARRVLDSTPLYDAVATMDTVTLIRSAIRGLLRVADGDLAVDLRSVLVSGDEYASSSKPQIDWDDPEARDGLIDSRARDAHAVLGVLDGVELTAEVSDAAELLATVVGQDLEAGDDGTFRIIRATAKDRVISTVDPDARHGRKTTAHRFDGYKGHIAVDPDSEIITDTAVGAANAGDAEVAESLIDDLVSGGDGKGDDHSDTDEDDGDDDDAGRPRVYGDAAYGTGEFLDTLANADIDAGCKTQPPAAPGGMFAKDRFAIDLDGDTVTCPNGVTVTIQRGGNGDGMASFADACAGCALRSQCTKAKGGRSVRVSRYEHRLADARQQQRDPDWKADYRATRPKVERKLGHLMRRRHGGRRARVRGKPKVDADFNLLAAAHNLARLAVLGLHFDTTAGWATAG
jgi:IS5 family transposase